MKSVLAVATNPEDRRLVLRQLPMEQFAVTFTSSADEAATLIREGAFDAAIIDCETPDMDSMALLRHLRSQHPTTIILLMTDYGDDELWVYGMNQGASDVVRKCILRRNLERHLGYCDSSTPRWEGAQSSKSANSEAPPRCNP